MEKPNFIDHIVLIAKDIKKTVDFYSSFLGKPVYQDEENATYKIGDTDIYFASSDGEFRKLDKDKGGINHLAFGVRNIEELRLFEERLKEANIKNSGIQIDKYGGKEFVWFDDPNGYRLEFYLRPDEDKNEFKEWMKIKEKLHFNNKNKSPLITDSDIWWLSIGKNVGYELDGKSELFSRPVLVFKKLSHNTFLGIPMTTKKKGGSWFVQAKQGGVEVSMILSQVRVFDTKRLSSRIGRLDDEDFNKVKTGFKDLFLP